MKSSVLMVLSGFVVVAWGLISCGDREISVAHGESREEGSLNDKKAKVSIREISYDEMLSGSYTGMNPEEVRAAFGQPEAVRPMGSGEVWHFGPKMMELRKASPGDVVGVTVFFDSSERVARITAKRKE